MDHRIVYVDTTNHPITITEDAYQQVVALLHVSKICQLCETRYTENNPMVRENVCLSCFLVRHRDLTFVGEHTTEYSKRYGYRLYKFLDTGGYISLARTNSDHHQSLETSIVETLLHYGFSVPKMYQSKEEEVALDPLSFRAIYGDFRRLPVVLVSYRESYSNSTNTAFILYTNGVWIELSKRKGETRQWYQAVKREIEQTYDPNSRCYTIEGDRSIYRIEDYHIYPGVVLKALEKYRKRLGTWEGKA